MGMEAGQKSGGPMVSVNVVPLIDVLLVLIIIFMVITPLTPKGLNALIPQPAPEKTADLAIPVRTVVVQVLNGGKLKINDDDVNWDTLGPRLNDVFKLRSEKVAFVEGDDTVRFQEVARAIDIMRQGGVDKVGLMTAMVGAAR